MSLELAASTENLPGAEPTALDLLPNDQMRRFAEDYATGCYSGKRFNKSASALAAGYSEGPNTGYRLYGRPDVRRAIDQVLDTVSLSTREIEARLIEMATAEIGEMVTLSPVTQQPIYDWSKIEKYKHLIKEFSFDSNGNPKIVFHDAHAALKDLIRVRGMAKEGVELSGPGGSAVPVQISVNFVSPHLRREENQTALPPGENQD